MNYITNDNFNPEWHGACYKCEKLCFKSALTYFENIGEYVCDDCLDEQDSNVAYNKAMEILK